MAARKAQSNRDKAIARGGGGVVAMKGGATQFRPRPKQNGNGSNGNGEGQSILAPTAIGRVQGASKPDISMSSNGGDMRVRVKHREYIRDITGSVAFALVQYAINPGRAVLFPWLSALAGLFESYKFNKLKFEYRTESSSTQVGKMLMSVDWDVLDSAPVTKQQMLQERTKAEAQVWLSFAMECDSADLLKFGTQRYIRTGAIPTVSDAKTYDVGNLFIATQGVTTAPVIGELWVSYDVELITPNTSPAPASVLIATGSATDTAPLTGATLVGNLDISTNANGTITFNETGEFLVEVQKIGTTLVATTLGGSTAVNTTTATSFTVNAAVTYSIESFRIRVAEAGQTLVLVTSADATTTTVNVRIGKYQYTNG